MEAQLFGASIQDPLYMFSVSTTFSSSSQTQNTSSEALRHVSTQLVIRGFTGLFLLHILLKHIDSVCIHVVREHGGHVYKCVQSM